MARVWDKFLTEQDAEHLSASHPQRPFGMGNVPVILSVDNYRAAVGYEPVALVEGIKKWPDYTGPGAWRALSHIKVLFTAARTLGIPIIHFTGMEAGKTGVTPWTRMQDPPHGGPEHEAWQLRQFDIVEQAAPEPGELVLRKAAPSAFFGTPLLAHLVSIGADTLIVCGETTSGCVRATVVDGRSYRLRMVVVEECVYDRHEASHAISLFDMNQKYADVLSIFEVTEQLKRYVQPRKA